MTRAWALAVPAVAGVAFGGLWRADPAPPAAALRLATPVAAPLAAPDSMSASRMSVDAAAVRAALAWVLGLGRLQNHALGAGVLLGFALALLLEFAARRLLARPGERANSLPEGGCGCHCCCA